MRNFCNKVLRVTPSGYAAIRASVICFFRSEWNGLFLRSAQMEEKTRSIIKKLKIDLVEIRKRVELLSGGQQQAVAISKAVSFNPKLVIMDEPTANLAEREIGKVLELINNLKLHGISVIIISHRLEDIFSVSDRIIVLRHGQIVGVRFTQDTDRKEILNLMFEG